MFNLIMLIELCKISKLVMHLNSCSMDLGRDNVGIRAEFKKRLQSTLSQPKSMEHEFRCMKNLVILHNSINIINSIIK